MSTTPQGSALPVIQTLAGLFGGIVNARQAQMENPRWGFSMLPVLSGAFTGLATGMQGAAQRAELLRQEARANADAQGQYALESGQSVSDIQRLLAGTQLNGYHAEVGQDLNRGQGNVGAATSYGVQNPQELFGLSPSLGSTIFGNMATAQGNAATMQALQGARNAGATDTGAPGTTNAAPLYASPHLGSQLPSLMQMLGMQAPIGYQGLNGKPQSISPYPQIQMLKSVTGGPPTPGHAAIPQSMGPNNVYQMASPQLDPGNVAQSSLSSGVNQISPPGQTLQQMMNVPDPQTVINQYTASANAGNALNGQITSRFDTASNNAAANERSILDYAKPSIPGIEAFGSPAQKQALFTNSAAGGLAGLMGKMYAPPTLTEKDKGLTQIQSATIGSGSREQKIAAIKSIMAMHHITAAQAAAMANNANGASDTFNESELGDGPNPTVSAPIGRIGVRNILPGLGGLPNINFLQSQSPYGGYQYSGGSY